jgi:hypothetical protein
VRLLEFACVLKLFLAELDDVLDVACEGKRKIMFAS